MPGRARVRAQRRQSFMKTRTKRQTGSSKRKLLNTGRTKRFVKRSTAGRFAKSVEVGRSLSADRRRKSRTKVSKGRGDRGET